MKQKLIVLFTLLSYLTSQGQIITERLILTDTNDSLLLKCEQPAFDKEGNYYFNIQEKGKEYTLTNKGKLKAGITGFGYGNNGEIGTSYSVLGPANQRWYYKNKYGVKVFGPAIGEEQHYMTSGTRSGVAITTTYADTIYYYANGQLVSKNHKTTVEEYGIDSFDWCALSENGNAIYYVKKDGLYHLYVNGKLIDKSVNNFNALHINNNGDYVYAEGRRPKVKTNGYDYMFFVHTRDTILGPVRTVWNNHLTENNSWYFNGDDNGTEYIIINSVMQKGIKYVANINFYGKGNYFYTFYQNNTAKINVNGKIFPCPVLEILLPAVDNEGNFAFYSIKDYYLYKFINGRQAEAPISKYGVRPTPLYISPKGESIHSFTTDDSIYLYRDEDLLFKPIARRSNYKVVPQEELFSSPFADGKTGNGNSLFYLEYGDKGYWVYNGKFSKPMFPAKEDSFRNEQEKGVIVAGECTSEGFFSVQRIDTSSYQININNTFYKELELDILYKDSFIFNDKELIFYGVKGLSIYQFKLSL